MFSCLRFHYLYCVSFFNSPHSNKTTYFPWLINTAFYDDFFVYIHIYSSKNSYCLFLAKMFTKIKLFSYDFCSLYAIFYNNNCWRRHRDSFHLVVKTCEKCLCLGVKMFNRGKCGAVLLAIFFLPMPKGANFRVITDT